jgi:hypothetical protein
MQPWEHPIPPVLYKYMPPERLHVLCDCRVRFSQRAAFEDDHELQPEFAAFGSAGEIWRFIISQGISLGPRIPPNVLVHWIAHTPKYQQLAMQTAQKNIKSTDELGVFCLTEASDCERMWQEYADNGRGFVIAFNSVHPGFEMLKQPGRIGKVSYGDEPFGTFLGAMESDGAGILFRKRTKYAFEREWRSIRFLHRLESRPGDIFVSAFDPGSVSEIVIRPNCIVEAELRQLVAADGRYAHAQVTVGG